MNYSRGNTMLNFIQTLDKLSDFNLQYVLTFEIAVANKDNYKIKAKLIDGSKYTFFECKTKEEAINLKASIIRQLAQLYLPPQKTSWWKKLNLKTLFKRS